MDNSIHPNKRNFIEGLHIIFDRWVAFRMALDMEWGGHDTSDKAQQFKEGLVDYFDRGGKVYLGALPRICKGKYSIARISAAACWEGFELECCETIKRGILVRRV
ncbi:hypothetical protein PSACC_00592 [Paramicrosporidium saccamoebae]|uniref:Uncharacterized protein n=1 Tax=Paramicrosporidium saccamoebae TaxID=1246581 RepID=A0A2H9TP97_9FUNG|nr:hypothetical protein PSACC_00592 [Paramicrosporidium saccamoebae]